MGYHTYMAERVSALQSSADPFYGGGNVLVIDAGAQSRTRIAEALSRAGLVARTGSGLPDITRHVAAGWADLVILAIGEGAGIDLLRSILARFDVPLIAATSGERAAADCVIALELGAEDAVTEPFSPHELAARARAVLRRVQASSRRERGASYRVAGWVVDGRARTLAHPSGRVIGLTRGEHALLAAFLEAPGRSLSREHLLRATRMHEDLFDRSIDVQVMRLRRKLAQGPGAVLRTNRGHGYVFTAAVERVETADAMALRA